MAYNLKYGILHWLIHFSIAHLSANLVVFSFFGYARFELLPLQQYFQIFLFFYLGTCLVDIDHLGMICKNGIKSVLNFAKMRRYPLHNLRFMIVFSFLATIFFAYQQILLGSFFTAMVFTSGMGFT